MDTSSDWTLTTKPLPCPPPHEIANPIVTETINENFHFFKIITPIDVNRFEALLAIHPNQLFVISVLHEGFWPWANTHIADYPNTQDDSLGTPKDPIEAAFIHSQRDDELKMECFSPPFGPHLLPGMDSSPIHGVLKPHSTKLWLVTNWSAGLFFPNSMISCEDVSGYPLDNMTHLGEMLLDIRKHHGNIHLVLFKSDIAEAYRLLPVHSYWQIKQVNTIHGQWMVDHNNCFGR